MPADSSLALASRWALGEAEAVGGVPGDGFGDERLQGRGMASAVVVGVFEEGGGVVGVPVESRIGHLARWYSTKTDSTSQEGVPERAARRDRTRGR